MARNRIINGIFTKTLTREKPLPYRPAITFECLYLFRTNSDSSADGETMPTIRPIKHAPEI
jgi:hypothetical protein